jgi:uncharacterized membrane protein
MNFVQPFINLFILAGFVGFTYNYRKEFLQTLKEDKVVFIAYSVTMIVLASVWGSSPSTYLFAISGFYIVLFVDTMQNITYSVILKRLFVSTAK